MPIRQGVSSATLLLFRQHGLETNAAPARPLPAEQQLRVPSVSGITDNMTEGHGSWSHAAGTELPTRCAGADSTSEGSPEHVPQLIALGTTARRA